MGAVIGTDLLETYRGELIFADRELGRADRLADRYPKRKVKTLAINVKDRAELVKVLKDSKATVLINAVNYYFNLDVMSACLEAGVNYLDLGGMFHTTKKQLAFDKDFKEKGILAIPGMGSSPGITNVLTAGAASRLDKINTIDISFADKDYTEYSTSLVLPYSILTLFEEFGDKPVIFKNGKYVETEPISGYEEKEFPKPLGNANCFFTLHSEAATLPTSFPTTENCWFRGGFDVSLVNQIKLLMNIGFNSSEVVKLPNGNLVSPRDLIVKMTEKFIPMSNTKINDIEFLRVQVTGTSKGKPKKITAYCQSFTNEKWNIPAGSWNTGVAPSVVAQLMDKGEITKTGVIPPELALNPAVLFKDLEKRAMKIWIENN